MDNLREHVRNALNNQVVNVYRSESFFGFKLVFGIQTLDKDVYLVPEDIVFKEYKKGERLNGLELNDATARQLMNQLWNLGVRPDGFADDSVIASMRSHITDLQMMNYQLQRIINHAFGIPPDEPKVSYTTASMGFQVSPD